MLDAIDNLLEMSLRLKKFTQFSKQNKKYQALQEEQYQGVNNNQETNHSTT